MLRHRVVVENLHANVSLIVLVHLGRVVIRPKSFYEMIFLCLASYAPRLALHFHRTFLGLFPS